MFEIANHIYEEWPDNAYGHGWEDFQDRIVKAAREQLLNGKSYKWQHADCEIETTLKNAVNFFRHYNYSDFNTDSLLREIMRKCGEGEQVWNRLTADYMAAIIVREETQAAMDEF